MYTAGVESGTVLSMNPDNTYVIPCYNDSLLPGSTVRHYGSNRLTENLGRILTSEGI